MRMPTNVPPASTVASPCSARSDRASSSEAGAIHTGSLTRGSRPRPDEPFTRIRSPVLIRSPALVVPTTAGMPNSRATTAGCETAPPASVTSPMIFVNSTTHAGLVIRHTRISPSRTWSNSSSEATKRAGPSTTPGEAARPRTSPLVAGSPAWNFSGKPQSAL